VLLQQNLTGPLAVSLREQSEAVEVTRRAGPPRRL